MLKNYTATYDSTVVKKIKDAGGIILGRTNMDEFALGGSGTNSSYGPTKNPLNTECVPGGSSSGSAASVAGDLCLIALGSDTGGSIRQPASMCGIVGYKPSYGYNSRSGLIAAASSLDTIGVFAKNLNDVKKVEEVISGFDILDNTTVPVEVRKEIESKNLKTDKSKVIAYPENFLNAGGIEEEVKDNFFKSLEEYKSKGFTILPVQMENLKYALSLYYVINTAEVSTNLSRFDGLRFGGGDVGDTRNYQELFSKNRGKFFGPEVKRRIMLGTYVLGTGYYDAYYGRAVKMREILRNEFNKVFEEASFIAMPTAPTVAWKTGDYKDPISLYLEDIFTVPANLVGVPGISIPNGFGKNNLPTGLQILGRFGDDMNLLQTFA
jgi:aspartyl-tRNA(Asn)/glutamyl-tRNA(Gln) amidotransferase subunit A